MSVVFLHTWSVLFQDYLCLKCYGDLHGKGFHKSHAPFCLVPCALCVVLPVSRR